MSVPRPLAVDLFAGAGGLSLGFEQAGFDVAAAVEVDPIHAATHEFNFPLGTSICASVADLSGADIRKRSGIEKREVAVVVGGAPCQGFSLIGKRVLDDPRNALVREFVRIVSELDAHAFVFENVKGLTVGRHKAFLYELIEAFEAKGYEVRQPWKVLNAVDFGVPQSRERLILMGVKRGERLPDYPMPITIAAGREGTEERPAGPSCKDALNDLPNADEFGTLLKSDAVRTKRFDMPSRYAAELRCMSNDAWHYGHPRIWEPEVLTSSARTVHTMISRTRFAEIEPGTVEPISRFYRLPPDGVSNTLRAGTDGARGAFTSPRPIHYAHPRCVTVREMARLHGFPDWFRFHGTKWHGARQIGNAVPPPLARAVAEKVRDALECKATRPTEAVALGDEALLSLIMSEAALHFGVPTPSGRRDRKSGAKKRRQADIERDRLAARAMNG